MSNNKLYSDILILINAVEDATGFIEGLQRLSNILFSTQKVNDQAIKEFLGEERAIAVLGYCKNNEISIENTLSFQSFIEKLISEIEQLPKVRLYLAFEPTQDSLKQFSDWFLKEYKVKFLFHIQVEKDIVGGAVMVFNGVYKDYSLKRKLNELTTKPDFIPL